MDFDQTYLPTEQERRLRAERIRCTVGVALITSAVWLAILILITR